MVYYVLCLGAHAQVRYTVVSVCVCVCVHIIDRKGQGLEMTGPLV